MKHIQIDELHIIGFKGIKDLVLSFSGHSAVISGRNGTGKTSVYDAFLWLLFGKVSDGSKADVKPLTALGARKSGVDCEVSARLLVDGTPVRLRRQWHEIWKKPAGGGEAVYDRDETLCWVDDVPVKLEKEYQPYVQAMVGGDEKTFQLLTDHGAFLRLHWTERRRQLMAMAGGDPESELLGRAEFAKVAELLDGCKPEEAKKRLMDRRKRLSSELSQLPARMDELERTLSPVSGEELAHAKEQLAQLEENIAAVDAEIANGQGAAGRLNELLRRKSAAARRVAEIASGAAEDHLRAVNERRAVCDGLLARQKRMEAEMAGLKQRLDDRYTRIAERESQRRDLLARYHEIEDRSVPSFEASGVCEACGQALPPERVEAALEKMRACWEQQREAELRVILEKGRACKRELENLTNEADELVNQTDVLTGEMSEMAGNVKQAETEWEEARSGSPNLEAQPGYAPAKEQLDQIEREIEAFGTDTCRQELLDRKAQWQRACAQPRAILMRAEQNETVKKRMEELAGEKKRLGTELVTIDGHIELLGEYVRACCSAMEEQINRHFRSIRWKLFDTAKNGSVQDLCTATVNGVPYGGGLNTGASINAGIEIIRALSGVYDISAPCFVDNAEAVNALARTDGQMIELRVSADEHLTMTTYTDD